MGKIQKNKGAVKLHIGLNHDGYLPELVSISDGKTADITAGRHINFLKGSIVVFDRGYNDYKWFNSLTSNGIIFVTRLKKKQSMK
jgi:Transposase DDE domain.